MEIDVEKLKYWQAIAEQEDYGRQLFLNVMHQIIPAPFAVTKAVSLPYKSAVDLELTATNMDCLIQERKVLVEVKCRYKDDRQLKEYPHCELLVDKLKGMKSYFRRYINKCKLPTALVYCVFNPNKNIFWAYNIRTINFRKISKEYFENNKITQFNPYSEREDQLTYQLPFELAMMTGPIYAVPEQTKKEAKTNPLF